MYLASAMLPLTLLTFQEFSARSYKCSPLKITADISKGHALITFRIGFFTYAY